MKSRLKITALAALLPVLLISCEDKPQEQSQVIKKTKAPQALKAEPGAEGAGKGEKQAEEKKKRNPFSNEAAVTVAKTKEQVKVKKGPLECCEVVSFKLVAVVNTPNNAFGLIESPDKKRYIVRVGDAFGNKDGNVVKINLRSITIREKAPEEPDKPPTTQDVELRLPLEPELKK